MKIKEHETREGHIDSASKLRGVAPTVSPIVTLRYRFEACIWLHPSKSNWFLLKCLMESHISVRFEHTLFNAVVTLGRSSTISLMWFPFASHPTNEIPSEISQNQKIGPDPTVYSKDTSIQTNTFRVPRGLGKRCSARGTTKSVSGQRTKCPGKKSVPMGKWSDSWRDWGS